MPGKCTEIDQIVVEGDFCSIAEGPCVGSQCDYYHGYSEDEDDDIAQEIAEAELVDDEDEAQNMGVKYDEGGSYGLPPATTGGYE
jgi:hypothetical protein